MTRQVFAKHTKNKYFKITDWEKHRWHISSLIMVSFCSSFLSHTMQWNFKLMRKYSTFRTENIFGISFSQNSCGTPIRMVFKTFTLFHETRIIFHFNLARLQTFPMNQLLIPDARCLREQNETWVPFREIHSIPFVNVILMILLYFKYKILFSCEPNMNSID